MRACVRACVRVCVPACVCVCTEASSSQSQSSVYGTASVTIPRRIKIFLKLNYRKLRHSVEKALRGKTQPTRGNI